MKRSTRAEDRKHTEGVADRIQTRAPWLEALRARLPILVFVCFAVQPVLDAVGYWQQRSETENVLTLILRMLLLGGGLLLGFLLTERKTVYCAMAGVLAVFTALHAAACLLAEGTYTLALSDLVNLVRIYFLPMTTLPLITFLRQNEKVWPALKKGLLADFGLIVLIELLAVLTGTDPHTYRDDGVGVLGWFLWTNSQSAILAMLMPILICLALCRWEKRVLPVALAAFAAELPLYLLGPKLAYACLLCGGLGIAAVLFLWFRPRWKQAVAILLVTVCFAAAFPLSPMQARRRIETARNRANHSAIDTMETQPSGEEQPDGEGHDSAETKPSRETLERIYKKYQYGAVRRFGLDRVLALYGGTTDASVLGDQRLKKINFCKLLMEDSGPMSRLFGLNVKEMRVFIEKGFYHGRTDTWEDGWESLDPENDFHGIYYLTGIVGLVLLLAFLIWFPVRATIRVLPELKQRLSPELTGFVFAFGFCMIHAIFTASVLRRNNASVYLAAVLAGLWYLTRQQATGNRQQTRL